MTRCRAHSLDACALCAAGDADRMRVAADVLQGHGVALDESSLRLLVGGAPAKFRGMRRGFYRIRHLPRHEVLAEILFGLYAPSGGTGGEVCMRWWDQRDAVVPRLEAFGDAWTALATFPDVLAWLASLDDGRSRFSRSTRDFLGPDEFCAGLRGFGFADMTEQSAHAERPGGSQEG